MKAVEFVAAKEKRYCNFAIRAHFHDAGSLGKDAPAPATVYGADGSLMLDKFECAPLASQPFSLHLVLPFRMLEIVQCISCTSNSHC